MNWFLQKVQHAHARVRLVWLLESKTWHAWISQNREVVENRINLHAGILEVPYYWATKVTHGNHSPGSLDQVSYHESCKNCEPGQSSQVMHFFLATNRNEYFIYYFEEEVPSAIDLINYTLIIVPLTNFALRNQGMKFRSTKKIDLLSLSSYTFLLNDELHL